MCTFSPCEMLCLISVNCIVIVKSLLRPKSTLADICAFMHNVFVCVCARVRGGWGGHKQHPKQPHSFVSAIYYQPWHKSDTAAAKRTKTILLYKFCINNGTPDIPFCA